MVPSPHDLYGTIRGLPVTHDGPKSGSFRRSTAMKKHVCLPWFPLVPPATKSASTVDLRSPEDPT